MRTRHTVPFGPHLERHVQVLVFAALRTAHAVTPTVSVVIPTHDRKDLLLLAVRSVLRQRDVEFEVLVVDDGSTDGTSAAVESLDEPRIRILRHERARGVATARNVGVAAARGSWIALLDDDDAWSPDKLALQLGAAEDAGSAWVYGGMVEIDLHGRLLGGDPPPSPELLLSVLARKNLMPAGCSNVVVRAEELSAVGGFDPGLRHLADWDLWLRLAQIGLPALSRAPVVAYRIHPAQATLDTAGMVAEARVLESRYGADPASIYRWLAWSHLRNGRRRAAFGAYALAVRTGDLLSLGRMAVAAAHPRPTSFGAGTQSPEAVAWQRDASDWLPQLADG
jgi:glycosyltransferase involved in cell wall biosynthesis